MASPSADHSADRSAPLPEGLSALFARAGELAALLDAPLSAVTDVPRPEHPRPQLHRPTWLTLNGTWQFEIDQGDSGRDRGLLERELDSEILVPFAPETEASGIGNRDYLEAVWYRRTATIHTVLEFLLPLLPFYPLDPDSPVWLT